MAKSFVYTTEQRGSRGYGLWSSCFLGTQRVVPPEHTEQLIPYARPRPREQLQWSSILLRAHIAEKLFQGADTAAPLEHMQHHRSDSKFSSSTAACAPAELLSMLQGSLCSMCSSGAAVCAPREPRLHVFQHAALCSPGKQLLHWSCCIL